MNTLVQIFADSKTGDAQGKISKYLGGQELLMSFGVYGPLKKKGTRSLFMQLIKRASENLKFLKTL